jgi:hypothetical protein
VATVSVAVWAPGQRALDALGQACAARGEDFMGTVVLVPLADVQPRTLAHREDANPTFSGQDLGDEVGEVEKGVLWDLVE